ncbi:glycosyltransferase family 4 protein [Patescibacteria group bacterium]|nr:glycosyltransferase family 4 protein [Patescibacteria group bacterium]
MVNILFLLNELDDISHTRMTLDIVSSLDKRKYNPYVYSLKRKGSLEKEFKSLVKEHFYISSENVIGDVLSIKNIISKSEISIVQTPALRSDFTIFAVRLLYFGRRPFFHIAVRFNYLFKNISLYHIAKKILYLISIRIADLNVCVGKHIRNRLIENLKIPSKKVCFIPNVISFGSEKLVEDNLGKNFNLKRDIPIILYTGSLIERKNTVFLVKCLALVKRPYYCFLVGEGPERKKIAGLIDQLNLKGKIILTGYFRHISSFLKIADIFVMPSKDEGLSLSVIEAMHAGVPSIVSDIEGNRELIGNLKEGLVFPLQDSKKFTSEISLLLENQELRRKLGENAIRKARKLYNFKKMLNEYDDLYQNVLKE